MQRPSGYAHLKGVIKEKNMKKSFIIISAIAASAALVSCSVGSLNMDSGMYPEYSAPNEGGYVPDEPGGDRYDEIVENDFINTADEPTSTFSVDCDGAAYANMRRFILESNALPPANAVRIEEYLNYFTFDYPEPQEGKTIALNSEIYVCPWNAEHQLLRLGIKGKSLAKRPASNFVFLIDVSGSMNSDDKLPLLKSSLKTLVTRLDPKDRVSIITYSGSVKKVLESTLASDTKTIYAAIDRLVASGSTNGGDAMRMAYEEALENYIEGGNNRVVMGTDGDFNVGVTSTEALVEMVESYARNGIYLTVCGFGRGNLNDAMIESVTNAGNGTYEYIDSEDEMTKVFVNDFGKFFAVANDVKAQITFDSTRVKSYRLIGYENRVLSNEDFENDEKDASEIGAGQTITALYELVMAETEPAWGLPVGSFDVRYKESLGTESILLSDELPSVSSEKLSANMALAAACASYGMVLRDSKYKGTSTFSLAEDLAGSSLDFDPYGYRAQFLELIQKASNCK